MDVMQAIRERRSVRKFRSESVSDDLVNVVLEAGCWAPSWANSQCWKFVVVRDVRIRANISETLSPRNPAADAVKSAPVTIVVCGELGKAGYYKGEAQTDKGDWYMFDTALAIQNMTLAAHSLGLGTVIIGHFDASKAAGILGVPSNVRVVALLSLGYPAEQPVAPTRKGLSQIAFQDQYGLE